MMTNNMDGVLPFTQQIRPTWNSFPLFAGHSPSFSAIESNLKTFLFKQYFNC